MRVQTIEVADFLISWTVVRDSDGAFQWIVFVTERSGERRTLFERRGSCGHVAWGDALDMAAETAHRVAVGLVEPAEPDEPAGGPAKTKPRGEGTPDRSRANH